MTETVLQHPTDRNKKVELEFPFNPEELPSNTQLLHRAISGKIYTATISGDRGLKTATIIRTYRVTEQQKNDLNTFLNDHRDEWTKPFNLTDPILNRTINNVYAVRSAFRGYKPFQNIFYIATFHFAVSPV